MADATAEGLGGARAGRPAAAAPVLAADGTPLARSLGRSLRRQKARAFLLVAPLLLFVLLTFVLPIGDMLLRSVENRIVRDTLPRTVAALGRDAGAVPGEAAFDALFLDLAIAEEAKRHTQLGTRLNYEWGGASSLFRSAGREVGGFDLYADQFQDADPTFEDGAAWAAWMAPASAMPEARAAAGLAADVPALRDALPRTADAYDAWAAYARAEGDDPAAETPADYVFTALFLDLASDDPRSPVWLLWDGDRPVLTDPPFGPVDVASFEARPLRDLFVEDDEAWGEPGIWGTIRLYSPAWTPGYFLNALDLRLTEDGIAWREADERIHLLLFARTLAMSLLITALCVLLAYPVAYLLAHLPAGRANLLLILVLLPFWTSLLVRTSAWKVLLQQQGVVNDLLVWAGLVGEGGRLALINNPTGTTIAMTHILLPFMILPMYSVMRGIPPAYVRAARSLGASDWTAFRRVYLPQSVPGVGAGSILVFILAIGYYITPELVGGPKGVFISNRIAYHVSDSLNWGLAAALGTVLLVVVLGLYWTYDRLVGIGNVRLGG